jgi:hypothetical protein
MAEFRLSTLDQNSPRIYLRYAFFFARNNSESLIVAERLQKAVKSLVSEVPMLAGTVTINDQQKSTSVTVTPRQVEESAVIIKHLEGHTQSYQDIYQGGFAPRHFEGIDLIALANRPEGDHSPSCVIQANLIDGGPILVVYLHHAIADMNGISTILRLMSEGLSPCQLDNDELQLEAKVVSQARSRLSRDCGAPAFLSLARDINQRQEQSRQQQHQHIWHNDRDDTGISSNNTSLNAPSPRSAILAFKLNTLLQTTEMLNSRRILRNPNSTTDNLTPGEVLISILWRAYARARYPSNTTSAETRNNANAQTSISFPINLRPILRPPLSPDWLGNASTCAQATSPLLSLLTTSNLSTLEQTVKILHTSAKASASDLLTRSRISLLNSSAPERDWTPTPQFVVHDWSSSVPVMAMEEQAMNLGLGLGAPDAVRRIGRGYAGEDQAVLLPVDWKKGRWEVQVEVEESVMRALAGDEGLRAWLWGMVG